jgi:hypothetical protein
MCTNEQRGSTNEQVQGECQGTNKHNASVGITNESEGVQMSGGGMNEHKASVQYE